MTGLQNISEDGRDDGLSVLMAEKCFLYVLIVLSLPLALERRAKDGSVIAA